jgi:hypothetical protein
MIIKYDVPIEVTKNQYAKIMSNLPGIVTGRIENDKYYIKVWFMKYSNHIHNLLK